MMRRWRWRWLTGNGGRKWMRRPLLVSGGGRIWFISTILGSQNIWKRTLCLPVWRMCECVCVCVCAMLPSLPMGGRIWMFSLPVKWWTNYSETLMRRHIIIIIIAVVVRLWASLSYRIVLWCLFRVFAIEKLRFSLFSPSTSKEKSSK